MEGGLQGWPWGLQTMPTTTRTKRIPTIIILFRQVCTFDGFLNGPTPASFCLFSFFLNKQYNCYKKSTWKIFIQYTPHGFEPMTSLHESSPITTRPGLPPYLYFCLMSKFWLKSGCVSLDISNFWFRIFWRLSSI